MNKDEHEDLLLQLDDLSDDMDLEDRADDRKVLIATIKELRALRESVERLAKYADHLEAVLRGRPGAVTNVEACWSQMMAIRNQYTIDLLIAQRRFDLPSTF